MYVQCLGSGDAFGSGGRLNSSFYVRTKSKGILIDCGASTLAALKQQNLSVSDIDIILISHLHGDHFGGLPFILCEMIAMGNRTKTLGIIGPQATEERTMEVLECFFPGIHMKDDTPVEFMTYQAAQPLEYATIQVTAFPAVHSPETNPHSLRVAADNTVISYSGDTEWSDALVSASMNADLFICEGSTWSTPVKHHLSIKELLVQRHLIHAKRIVLTHLGEEALIHIGDIPFTVATDGMVLMHDS